MVQLFYSHDVFHFLQSVKSVGQALNGDGQAVDGDGKVPNDVGKALRGTSCSLKSCPSH
jgi:hypothetical protein